MSELRYEFAKTDGGEEVGFNDSVTTSFKGHIAYFLARESIQNIIDVVDDQKKPVIADIQLRKINANEIPKSKQLEKILLACKEYFYNNSSNVDFFGKAHRMIKRNEKISILTIGDYNTKGMSGDDDDINGNYYNFLKSSGASQKKGGSGGSFGLGKGAYYAASAFHMIFVSSMHGHDKHLFQGKLRLVSHKSGGEMYQSTGSFGYIKQKPVRVTDDVPKLFMRNEKGTDIHIVGFYDDDDWEKQITRSVLNNFWMAILKEKLIVKIGKKEVSHKSLEKFMHENFEEFGKEDDNNQNPMQPFLAYTGEKSTKFKKTLPILGDVQLSVILKENYNKKISFFRKTGMQIMKKTHSGSVANFVGVFTCENEKGNEILRAMENPQHDKWDPENAREKTDEVYNNSKKANKEMKKFIKECLREMFAMNNKESMDVPGLSEYLFMDSENEEDEQIGAPSESGKETGENTNEESANMVGVERDENPTVEIAHPIRVIKSRNMIKTHSGKEKISTRNSWDNEEDESGVEGKILKHFNFRSFSVVEKGRIKHNIILHGNPEQKVTIKIKIGTDDAFDKLIISKAIDQNGNILNTFDNSIYGVELNKNGLNKLGVYFEDEDKHSLQVTAYENK